MYTRETEIRHMSSPDIYKLAQILDHNNAWEKLMQIIPKESHSNSPEDMAYKYNYDHVRLVKNVSIKHKSMATEILIEEWGTSGKKRPTMGVLLDLLVKAELFKAADLVALDYLNEAKPGRPHKGPSAPVDINIPLDSESINDVEAILNDGDSNFPGTATLNDNAESRSLVDDNIDFYEKYQPNQKQIDIPPASSNLGRLLTDNGATAHETTEISQRIHSHSELIKFSSTSITDSQGIPDLPELLRSTIIPDTNISHANISHSKSIPVDTQQSAGETLPNLSVLNVENIELDDDNLRPPDDAASVLSSSSASSISSTPDDELSMPILSILDQRSSNNDSSLTNVTGTSEDNSEMSLNEGSASNDNMV